VVDRVEGSVDGSERERPRRIPPDDRRAAAFLGRITTELSSVDDNLPDTMTDHAVLIEIAMGIADPAVGRVWRAVNRRRVARGHPTMHAMDRHARARGLLPVPNSCPSVHRWRVFG